MSSVWGAAVNQIWSWVLMAVGVTGLWLAGRGIWWSWFVGLGAQVLWLAYAIVTGQWGFIVSAFAYGFVYARNGVRWMRQRPRPTKRERDIERVIRRVRKGNAIQLGSAEGKTISKESRDAISQAVRRRLRDIHRDTFEG